ncbi:unnamed protein product [Acanthoscelides obtectus]|uniref:Uncharacterized protein n=1 Tax=Acanthoscelides obtectus TaxID=200917 RepID=A0A9P0PX66_ACAOB|nr:unnamed protein product [Acanthoscelides obtectus]CAK1649432.1 hypothetical protein AOBTE_LOCUS16236 [Acanthoscelides obtectus]
MALVPINIAAILAVEEEERLDDICIENMERRLMRNESGPFSLEDVRFKGLFRLNKDMAQYVLNGIIPHLNQVPNPVAVPVILKFFAALHFYATGT